MKSNKSAVTDGKKVRAFRKPHVHAIGSDRRRFRLSSDQVCAIIQTQIREALGDRAENRATVYAKTGFFHIRLSPINIRRIKDVFWRKYLREGGNLRRYSLGLMFRAMRGEVLTG